MFYLVVTALFVVAGTGLRWLDGTLPAGSFSPPRISIDILAVYGFAAMHHAKWAAQRSLERFRPALGNLEPQFDVLRHQLTTLSRRSGLVTLAIAVAFTTGSLITGAEAWDITSKTSPGVAAFFVVEAFLLDVAYAGFILLAYWQIRAIVRIHREATNVGLLQNGANSSFSSLTLSLSISVGLPVYISATSFALIGLFFVGVSILDVFLLVGVLVTAALVFFVPLSGMHRRLVREKAAALDRIGGGIGSASDELHARIAAGRFEELEGMKTALDSLAIEKDAVRRASTWPWQVETLRGFLSSIALPLLLWLATTVLGRVING